MLNAAATGAYGVTKGGKNATHLTLTPAGIHLAEANDAVERLGVAYDILFDNSYFAALVEKYRDRPIPNDAIAADYLEREQGLSAEDAETCWTVAKQNIFDFGLFEESGSKRVILAREDALAQAQQSAGATPGSDDDQTSASATPTDVQPMEERGVVPSPIGALPSPERASRIVPQIAFNIQVVLPENASSEVYDAIFASMATHLLGRTYS